MIGRAARNIGGEVIMYADTITESMRAAIDETNRRREVQEAYNKEHGIEPTTIIKGIHDINERLRARGRDDGRLHLGADELAGRALSLENEAAVEKLVAQMEAEMKCGRQAARVRARRRAARRDPADPAARARAGRLDRRRPCRGARGGRGTKRPGAARGRPGVRPQRGDQVTSVTVLPAAEEPAESTDSTEARLPAARPRRPTGCPGSATSTTTRPGLAGALARPPDVGPHGDAEHQAPHRREAVENGPPTGIAATDSAERCGWGNARPAMFDTRAPRRISTYKGTGEPSVGSAGARGSH